MSDKKIYGYIDKTIRDSEMAVDPGSSGLNVASTNIHPEEYIGRVAYLNAHVNAGDLRDHILDMSRGVDSLSEKFMSGELGEPSLSRRASIALAKRFVAMR